MRWPTAVVLGLLPVAVIGAITLSLHHGAGPSGPRSAQLSPAAWASVRAVIVYRDRRLRDHRVQAADVRAECAVIPPSGDAAVEAQHRGCEATAATIDAFHALAGCRRAQRGAPRRACLVESLHNVASSVREVVAGLVAMGATVLPGSCQLALEQNTAELEHLATTSDDFANAAETAETVVDIDGPMRDWALDVRRLATGRVVITDATLQACRPAS